MNNIKNVIPTKVEESRTLTHLVIPSEVEESRAMFDQTPPLRSGLQACGFTLVELAIALMVIGLLIGGVLKGQELIENARITRTIKDINDYNTAVVIFQSSYNSLPGDIRDTSRIPNCTDACADQGNENSLIGEPNTDRSQNINSSVSTPVRREPRRFWLHLAKTGLLSGVINAEYTGTPNVAGIDFPQNPFGITTVIARFQAATADDTGFPFPEQSMHYFTIIPNPGSPYYTSGGIKSSIVLQIDQKIDDGMPLTGKVRAGRRSAATGSCLQTSVDAYLIDNGILCTPAFQTNF